MTATELYEIVKDHPDVWGKDFVIVVRGDGTAGFFRQFSNDELDPEHVENELLGLGVKWLVENSKHNSVAVARTLGDWQCITYTEEQWCATLFGPSPVAAVYAAIAEVNRG